MNRVQQIEGQIEALDQTELKVLREWFAQYDADIWDKQIETDARNGRLLALAEHALRDHDGGHSTEL